MTSFSGFEYEILVGKSCSGFSKVKRSFCKGNILKTTGSSFFSFYATTVNYTLSIFCSRVKCSAKSVSFLTKIKLCQNKVLSFNYVIFLLDCFYYVKFVL